jgi:hypothetical protein
VLEAGGILLTRDSSISSERRDCSFPGAWGTPEGHPALETKATKQIRASIESGRWIRLERWRTAQENERKKIHSIGDIELATIVDVEGIGAYRRISPQEQIRKKGYLVDSGSKASILS